MKALVHRLGGTCSRWLLARPSNREVGQANLRIAFGICALIGLISVGFVIAQWAISERLYALQKAQNLQLEQSLDLTQEMATRLSNAHRAVLNVLLAKDPVEMEEALKRREENLERYSSLLKSQKLGGSSDLIRKQADLVALAESYAFQSAMVVDLFAKGRGEEAVEMRISKLRPIFDRWQQTQDEFSIGVNIVINLEQEQYLQAVGATRLMLLALLIIPTVLVFAGLVAIVAVIGWQHWGGKIAGPSDTWAR